MNFTTELNKKGDWWEAKIFLNGKTMATRSCRRKKDAAEYAKSDIKELKEKLKILKDESSSN